MSTYRLDKLFSPRSVALVGASPRPTSPGRAVLRNLRDAGFKGSIHLVNPRRSEIWDRPCYPDFKSLPEAPDHLVVLVPAAGVAETLRSGAAAGARSATVFSAGFGEAFDSQAAALGRELAAVIAETGLGVSGPNCMGNVCAKSRLVTLTEDRPLAVRSGPAALVGQSGGMMIFINAALEERGIWAEYLITSGNEAGLSVPDYVAFFADRVGLTPEQIRATVQGDAAAWSGEETLLIRLVDELHDKADIADELWTALADAFTVEQIFELIALVGFKARIGEGSLRIMRGNVASIDGRVLDQGVDL